MTDRPGPIRNFFHVVTRRWLGLIGTALTTASALMFVTLYAMESLGFHAGPYLFANIGLFEPNSYSDGLAEYSSDWSGNIAIGSRLSPFGAIEGGVGSYTASAGSNEVSVVPVTIGARLIIPHPVFEVYFGGGIGAYFLSG